MAFYQNFGSSRLRYKGQSQRNFTENRFAKKKLNKHVLLEKIQWIKLGENE